MVPEEGSERALRFQKNRQCLQDVVKDVISRRREGSTGEEHVPFVDSLLQSGVPDDQVRMRQRCIYDVQWNL